MGGSTATCQAGLPVASLGRPSTLARHSAPPQWAATGQQHLCEAAGGYRARHHLWHGHCQTPIVHPHGYRLLHELLRHPAPDSAANVTIVDLRRAVEQAYRVRFDECGPDGSLPASGFLRYVQDMAWVHSQRLGFGRAWYAERGLTWLIRALAIELHGRVEYGESLNVSTEVKGFRRVWARRRSEVRGEAGGPLIATALIDWVLLDAQGRPSRIPEEILAAFVAPPGDTSGPLRVRLNPPPPGAIRQEFSPRRSELDPLAHVNNAVYIDYLDDQLARTGDGQQLARLPRAYEVEFVVPAGPETPLVGSLWRDDGGWSYRLESTASQELVRAKMRS